MRASSARSSWHSSLICAISSCVPAASTSLQLCRVHSCGFHFFTAQPKFQFLKMAGAILGRVTRILCSFSLDFLFEVDRRVCHVRLPSIIIFGGKLKPSLVTQDSTRNRTVFLNIHYHSCFNFEECMTQNSSRSQMGTMYYILGRTVPLSKGGGGTEFRSNAQAGRLFKRTCTKKHA